MSDPNAPRMFRLRASFVERGRLAMLSHLEVAHTLERTVRRARLPFAVSQGFSPHMKIAFGAALPVGVGSVCEVFDVQLTEYVACDKALASLQAASVPDLMVQDCAYIEKTAPAASVAFPFSTYEVRFDVPVKSIQVPDSITVVRKRKEKELAVKDFLAMPFALEAKGESATFTLEAKPTGSLRPDVLLQNCVFEPHAGSRVQSANIASVTRIRQSAENPR